MVKVPSEKLQMMLRDVRQSYEDTASRVMACFKQAINEGYDQRAARKLIVENVGLSDRMVRNYLPAEAKDMRHDPTKKDGKPKEKEIELDWGEAPVDHRIAKLEARIAELEERLAEAQKGKKIIEVDQSWHLQISNFAKRGEVFALTVTNGKITDIAPIKTAELVTA